MTRPEQIAEYVVGPDGQVGKRRGAHADDQNGVCIWCGMCADFYCCGRLNCCGPTGEPVRTTHNDGPEIPPGSVGEAAANRFSSDPGGLHIDGQETVT